MIYETANNRYNLLKKLGAISDTQVCNLTQYCFDKLSYKTRVLAFTRKGRHISFIKPNDKSTQPYDPRNDSVLVSFDGELQVYHQGSVPVNAKTILGNLPIDLYLALAHLAANDGVWDDFSLEPVALQYLNGLVKVQARKLDHQKLACLYDLYRKFREACVNNRFIKGAANWSSAELITPMAEAVKLKWTAKTKDCSARAATVSTIYIFRLAQSGSVKIICPVVSPCQISADFGFANSELDDYLLDIVTTLPEDTIGALHVETSLYGGVTIKAYHIDGNQAGRIHL